MQRPVPVDTRHRRGERIRRLRLQDGDPVATEVRSAREDVLAAALSAVDGQPSPVADLVRKQFKMRIGNPPSPGSAVGSFRPVYDSARRSALQAARGRLLELRESGDIGDQETLVAAG